MASSVLLEVLKTIGLAILCRFPDWDYNSRKGATEGHRGQRAGSGGHEGEVRVALWEEESGLTHPFLLPFPYWLMRPSSESTHQHIPT